jgi:DNA-binding NarL/FixJ family response regulator
LNWLNDPGCFPNPPAVRRGILLLSIKLRILVADDHEIVRRGLCDMLAAHEGWEVCGEAIDGMEAVSKAVELKPDVVVIDIGMPNLNGIAATEQMLKANPDQKIIILTITDAEQVIVEALRVGARGFVLKSDAARDLVAAVEALQRHRTFFTPRVGEMISNGFLRGEKSSDPTDVQLPRLTARERQVIQLVAEGKSTKEVASLLNVSTKTAETHRSNIMRKLDLHSTSELVMYAIRNHIVQVLPDKIA